MRRPVVSLAACGLLLLHCGAPARAQNAARDEPKDASVPSQTEGDASLEDAAPEPLAAAPPLLLPAMSGIIAEPEQSLSLRDSFRTEFAMPDDGCVRVVFSAGAPVLAALGPSVVRSAAGVLGPRGPVCERGGHTLALTFSGLANVRYQVFRTR